MSGIRRLGSSSSEYFCHGPEPEEHAAQSEEASTEGAAEEEIARQSDDIPEGAAPGPYAEGALEDEGQSGHLAVGLLRSRDTATGIGAEVFSVAGQYGRGVGASVAMARVEARSEDGDHRSVVETFTAHADVGYHNADGSIGLHAEMGATAIGVEVSHSLGPISVTAGVGIGVGMDASLGLRPADGAHGAALCGRVSFAWWTLGACVGGGPDLASSRTTDPDGGAEGHAP